MRSIVVVAHAAILVAFVALVASGCVRGGDKCTSNADCDVTHDGSRACDLADGTCKCVDDFGCQHGETCNVAGRCQAVGGCHDDDDCAADQFCAVSESQCEPRDVCGAGQQCCSVDAECAFGSICDAIGLACIPGCRDDADCVLGEGCAGAGFGHIGQCGTACTADNECALGQLCSIAAGKCARDTRGPYCFGCSGGIQSRDCGEYGNYCLLDTVNGGDYCGVDCSDGEACPNGYDCKNVIILPRATLPTCSLPETCDAGRCARTQSPCSVDEDCAEGPPGSDCPRAHVGNCSVDTGVSCSVDGDCATGECLKQECRLKEGSTFGVCSCTRNADCPRDRCVDADQSDAAHIVFGHCELSGHRCLEDAECDVITCVNGGCLLGKNCKPAADRTCADFVNP